VDEVRGKRPDGLVRVGLMLAKVRVDRLILRMAVWELKQRETPPAVVLNEAIELARTFGTDESVRFVNGVLDAIRKTLEGQGPPHSGH